MQQEKNKKAATVFWVLSVICMAVIFWFSSKTATVSTGQSNVFVQWLINLFGESDTWVFIVRKSAHCLEFTGLAFLLGWAFLFTRGKNNPLIPLLFTSVYGLTDEIHQIFVEGRSCEFRDWAIDTLGAIIGILGFIIIIKIFDIIKEHKRKKE